MKISDLEINPDAINPLYGDAIRLSEIESGLALLTVNKETEHAWISILSSSWRLEESCHGLSTPYEDLFKPCIVADGSKGEIINLSAIGVCPGPAGWSQRCFSVAVTRGKIRSLHFELEKEGLYRASNNTQRLTPGYFGTGMEN